MYFRFDVTAPLKQFTLYLLTTCLFWIEISLLFFCIQHCKNSEMGVRIVIILLVCMNGISYIHLNQIQIQSSSRATKYLPPNYSPEDADPKIIDKQFENERERGWKFWRCIHNTKQIEITMSTQSQKEWEREHLCIRE